MNQTDPDTAGEDALALLNLIDAGGAAAPRRLLLEQHGSAAAVLAAGPRAWRAAELSEKQIDRLRTPQAETLDRASRWLGDP
ncbi:DNA-protecting protein DprA, partial [Lysobacter capsici]